MKRAAPAFVLLLLLAPVAIHAGDLAVLRELPEGVKVGLGCPDCGFAPGKDHEVPLEEACLKLKNLAAAARSLRQEHD